MYLYSKYIEWSASENENFTPYTNKIIAKIGLKLQVWIIFFYYNLH